MSSKSSLQNRPYSPDPNPAPSQNFKTLSNYFAKDMGPANPEVRLKKYELPHDTTPLKVVALLTALFSFSQLSKKGKK